MIALAAGRSEHRLSRRLACHLKSWVSSTGQEDTVVIPACMIMRQALVTGKYNIESGKHEGSFYVVSNPKP